ncbi:MAG: pilus assembly protein PilM [Candidatus Omnitrophica bacterium]|nr:pilus assembly protein PilM [Candidatus Omnitrophota bacterium]
MAKITTTVEIKRDILRVVQLKKGIKDVVLLGYLEERLPFIPSLELEENVELIIAKVRALLQKLPLKAKTPIFVIPTSEIMLRFFDLPFLPKKDRAEAIKYEAQKYIPFAIDDIASDFYIPYEIKGKEMRVVYMAVKYNVLNRYIKIASALGMKISAIEPYPFSLLRALFTSGDLKAKDFVLVVDLDYSGSTILVTQGLNIYIARDFIVSPVSEITSAQVLNKIVFEINRTIDYMIKEFPQQQIKEVVLTGEVASDEIRESLMNALGSNVRLASLENKIASDKQGIAKKHLGITGAGLRSLVSYDIDLDFFSDYRGKSSETPALSIKDFMPKELIQDLIMLFISIVMAGAYLNHQVKSVENMAGNISLPQGLSSTNSRELLQDIKGLENKVKFLRDTVAQREKFVEIFNFIPANLTQGIWLDSLQMAVPDKKGAQEFLVTGYGYGSDSQGVDLIYNLLDALNRSEKAKKLFSDIKIVNVEKSVLEGFPVIKFSLKAVMK